MNMQRILGTVAAVSTLLLCACNKQGTADDKPYVSSALDAIQNPVGQEPAASSAASGAATK